MLAKGLLKNEIQAVDSNVIFIVFLMCYAQETVFYQIDGN